MQRKISVSRCVSGDERGSDERRITEAECRQADGAVRYQVGRVDRDSPVVVGAECRDGGRVDVFGRIAEEPGHVQHHGIRLDHLAANRFDDTAQDGQ